MAPPTATHYQLLLLSILLLCRSSQQQQQISPADLAALLDIKSSLRDLPGSNFFATWNPESSNYPCTSFAGVICSPSGDDRHLRVSVLTLGTGLSGSPGLTGTLPASLSNLNALTELVVYPGRISGTIPSNLFSSLPRLRLVSISNNLITGPIPETLFSNDLHTLDLSHNRLTGTIPAAIFSSSSLKVLILASNSHLSGELPPGVATTQLLHLDVRQNNLTGTLPALPATLRYLSASSNSFTGSLAAALASPPPELAFLDLSTNGFTGWIPPAIFSLPWLSSILLQRNDLSGPLPAVAPASAEWEVVDLSHNALTGGVPAALAGAASLYLNSNRLTGAVPAEYARSVYSGEMSTFYLQHNFLTEFPAPPLPLPEGVSVCLAYNCMVPPADSSSGCPANAGTDQQRPREQCPGGGG